MTAIANAKVMVFSNLVNDKPNEAKEIIMQMNRDELLKMGSDIDALKDLFNLALGTLIFKTLP